MNNEILLHEKKKEETVTSYMIRSLYTVAEGTVVVNGSKMRHGASDICVDLLRNLDAGIC